MANINQRFGSAIFNLRSERSVSQEQLATLAGVSVRYMSDIENGKRQISLEYAERIAFALEMNLSEIITKVENLE